MIRVWLVILCLHYSSGFAQDLSLKNSLKLPQPEASLVVDRFGKMYFISESDLTKLSPQLQNEGSFSDLAWGEISTLSVLNPMNPLLFYRDYGQVRILDNRLNESQMFSLFDLGLIDPTLVGQSDEQSIWVFDQSLNQLLRIDLRKLEIVNRSLNLNQILPDSVKLVALECAFNRNVLLSEEGHFLIFDAFGTLLKTLAQKDQPLDFTLAKNKILALYSTGMIEIIPLDGSETTKLILPQRDQLREIYAWGDQVYIWAGQELYHYLLN